MNIIENVSGIESKNSLAYVDKAFRILNNGGTFVSLRNSMDKSLIKGLQIDSENDVVQSNGWYSGEQYFPQLLTSPAQISFTSGTEGAPKAVVVSHAALANTTRRLIEVMAIDSSIKEYIGIPVNYSFGFGRCRAVSSVGGDFYLPAAGFDPLEIVSMLEKGEINAISAVPSLWRIILESPELFADVGVKVLWIEIGSQYMSADEKSNLRNIFPKAKIVQHYGLTEASRSVFLDVKNEPMEVLESVGKEGFGVQVAIDESGRIKLKGPHLATLLIVGGEIVEATDKDGWFVTNDKGTIQNGYLYYEGRIDDIINCGGVKLSPDQIEQELFDKVGTESNLVAFKIAHESLGEQLALGLEKNSKVDKGYLLFTVAEILKTYGVNVGKNISIFELDEIPKTETGKVKRSYLSKQFSSNTEMGSVTEAHTSKEKSSVLINIWQDVLKIDSISSSDSFFDLGGDSLSAIRVILRMEKEGIPKEVCRKIFEGYSIDQIVANTSPSPESNDVDGIKVSAEDLIEIWSDVLKIDKISTSDSFFDLGGDSLSAIRVILRMEKAGVPKEICRKIFEGHSIQQIVESVLPAEQVETKANAEDKSAVLIEIWEKILKIDNISVEDSFFDLGGDSLSAIRVIVRMEAVGIPKDVCRKIFEGHSIRQIVGDKKVKLQAPASVEKPVSTHAQVQTSVADSILKRTPIASANLSLNVIRGLLVIMNIAAHWMPGVMVRLPSFVADMNRYLAPLYSSGTPGFVMVFGAGIGFFMLPRYNKNKQSVNKLAISNAVLLAFGILALAIVRIAGGYFSGEEITGLDISNSLYSVLYYYFFAVISIPLWLKVLTWKSNFSFSCLGLAGFFYACHLYVDYINISPSENPLIQPLVLLANAKYNYFEMTAAVLVGAAAGHWIKKSIEKDENLIKFGLSGIMLIGLSVMISIETGEYSQWFVWPKGLFLWTWPFYLGGILIGFYEVYRYLEKSDINSHKFVGVAIKLISVIGVMAFPLFIGHELVRPTAELLEVLSVPGGLLISMALFFAYSTYLLRKIYHLYYGGK